MIMYGMLSSYCKYGKIRVRLFALVLTLILSVLVHTHSAIACTSAIISAEMNPYGRPMLWKHRDTSTTDNKVEYVAGKEGEYSYVGLFNAGDKRLEQVWIGMNDVGFAIMNTASYNLKDDKVSKKLMDREGYVMSRALKQCRSVDDFARLLETLPRPLGVEANFGVIDAAGNGAFFETNNHSYQRFDLKDAEGGVLVRTNYSHSGRKGEGYGHVREANAKYLLAPYIQERNVTPEVLTEEISRLFYRDREKRDFSGDAVVIDDDFIPRYKSTATVVIEGCVPLADINSVNPGDLKQEYIMWTGIGYPPCSEILPVYCDPGGVPAELRGLGPDGHSSLGDKVKGRRDEVFTIKKGDRNKYINMRKLFNDEGTGYVQVLTRKNLETYRTVRDKRDKR